MFSAAVRPFARRFQHEITVNAYMSSCWVRICPGSRYGPQLRLKKYLFFCNGVARNTVICNFALISPNRIGMRTA